ncbi:methyltransferase domain-containing protein [Paenactinomyces guangxiensis]|uniref:Methyltransferase domain-containing protein n=1 Tax=Paenactinomyces guangxiensis TaxID=1490290 RepID=A0A7W1WS32_9BACL|nr:methyltransferase domain-containing protein [Paenactinomyces guangxiensis]MBA4494831.1 methyltransferase domain-containing protein [Paenactinomyces guangxiensis]MBH8591914.1 methyltransferase domain-containing protein [Paenactinomyces guangxiensis]
MLIQEIARRLKVTPRTIRFYEEKGLISPKKDQSNQYRIFSEKEAWRLQTIIALREVGMPIEKIKQVLDEMDKGEPEEVLYYLQLQQSVLFTEWLRMKQVLSTLDQMIHSYDSTESGSWEKLWELAEQSRHTRAERNKWEDRWNFDRQAQTYDQQVQRHSEDFDVHRDYDKGLDLVLEWTKPQPHETGLEIGVGTGNLSARFVSRGYTMKGIDQSKEMLKVCRQKVPALETRIGNFLAIPYPDQSFHFVVTSYALHHLTDDQKMMALEEMNRVLKPGGRICILDLMFEDEAARSAYLKGWLARGKEEVVRSVEDEYYADKSRLSAWLQQENFRVKTEQINDILHIVYAEGT